MQSSLKRIAIGVAIFTLTLVVAVIGYMLFGWALLDAVYMVIITIFGVGYGEVRPLSSPAQKLFTIGVIVAGTSSAVYIVGGFVQMVMEGELHRALDARRKSQGIENLQQHAIICGFGRMGQILARELAEARYPFAVVDSNPDRAAIAEDAGYLCQCGNASDETVLKSLGIDRAKILATVLPDDATNVFITLTARELNQDLIILARGELPTTEKKLRLAGANHVVLPAAISANRMANLITRPSTIDFLEQDAEHSTLNDMLAQIGLQLDELSVPPRSPSVGSTVGDLEVQGKGMFIVVALRKADGTVISHPTSNLVLEGGDTAIVMGHQGDLPKFARSHRLKRQIRYRGASI